LLINAVDCRECDTIVFSRTEGDVRSCDCGRIVVSGGQHYFKYDVYTNPQYEIKKMHIEVTLEDLYDDWDTMKDEYGIIRNHPLLPGKEMVQIF